MPLRDGKITVTGILDVERIDDQYPGVGVVLDKIKTKKLDLGTHIIIAKSEGFEKMEKNALMIGRVIQEAARSCKEINIQVKIGC